MSKEELEKLPLIKESHVPRSNSIHPKNVDYLARMAFERKKREERKRKIVKKNND